MPPHPSLPAAFLPFVALLRGEAGDLLALDAPLWLTRAPGRLDVLGGPGEFPGDASLSVPLARSAYAALQNRADARIRIRVLRPAAMGGARGWEGDIGHLYTKKGPPRSLAVLRQTFAGELAWMMEIVAAMLGLRRTRQLNTPKHGFELVIWDRLPPDPGYGRAAAFATAVALALKAATGLAKKRVDGIQVAKAVVHGAREVLGLHVPISDALTSSLGRRNCALYIEHGLDPAMQWIPLPAQCLLAAVDLGVAPQVGPADFQAAEVGAEMALAHLNAQLRKERRNPIPGWGKAVPSEFDEGLKQMLPLDEEGGEWLKRYRRGHEEVAARVDKDRKYRLRALADHHVHESERVRQFVSNLSEFARTLREGFLGEAGRCLQRSEQSLREKCGFAFPEMAPFIQAVAEAGREEGLFGVRPADCGRSGVVAVLLHQSARQLLRELAEQRAPGGRAAASVLTDTEDGGSLNAWWEGILEPKEGSVAPEAASAEPEPAPPLAHEPRARPVRPLRDRGRERDRGDYGGDFGFDPD